MGTIELRTAAPERARTILRQALERERRLIADGISRTREKVTGLIEKTGVDPDGLRMGRVPHPEDRDMELLELEGEMAILTALEEQLRVLDELQICP